MERSRIEKLISEKCSFRDIFIVSSYTSGFSFSLSKIKNASSGSSAGGSVRIVNGDFTRLESFSVTPETSKVLKKFGLKMRKPDVSFDMASAEKFAVELDSELREYGRDKIKNIELGFSAGSSFCGIFDGEDAKEKESYRQKFFISVITESGGEKETAYDHFVVTRPVRENEFFEICRKKSLSALKLALALLDAAPPPSGAFPVLISSSAGGTLIHEAIGHSLEADAIRKGTSPVYAGKLNSRVASSEVTVIDDATMKGKNGSYEFDDEGVPARKVILIEKGVLKDYLFDRLEANLQKTNSNGHGRRDSHLSKPIPRMGITYLAAGKSNFEEMMKKVKRGLLVKKMGGGQVNPANGDFVFEVREGYLIEGGQVGRLVKKATIAGNGPEILRKIKYIGQTVGFDDGTCGKDGQSAPVSDGMPDTLIPELIVGGTTSRREQK